MKKCIICNKEFSSNRDWQLTCSKKCSYKRQVQKTHRNGFLKYRLDRNRDRFQTDRNEIVIKKNYAEVILYNRQSEEVARTIIDIKNVNNIKYYKWHLTGQGYVKNTEKGWLHYVVKKKRDGFIIDHINRNKLDNREKNLRYATYIENNRNKKANKPNKHGFVGLTYDERDSKWYPNVYIKGKVVGLGGYKDKKDAIKARIDGEIKYYKEFALKR